MIEVIIVAVVVILGVTVAVQRSKVVIAKRTCYELKKSIAKERNATADILRLSKEVINQGCENMDFLPNFVEYALRTLKGTGGAILECDKDGSFYGCAIAGTFPSLREVSVQVEQQLMAHAKKHTESFRGYKVKFSALDIDEICGEKGFAFYRNQCPIWFPERFIREAPRILMAPIKVKNKTLGCVIITSNDDFDSPKLTEEDGKYLVRLTEIASMSLEVLRVFRERQEYEINIQTAKEEGMMQVSTGIIHNIGNAVTVAKLSVLELQERLSSKKEERPETLIMEEILPNMKEKLANGSLEAFLKNDDIGCQYFEIIVELLRHIGKTNNDSVEQLKSLSSKLYHISEIIELQQRFVGELGTENMTQLSSVLDSAIKIFEETFNKRGVRIETEFSDEVPEVLIDSSMLTQVVINFIKNAVEAIDSEQEASKDYHLKLRLYNNELVGEPGSIIEIEDNGPGMPEDVRSRIFDFGFSTKGAGAGRGYGLHSCMDTIKKYNGNIEVESEPGKGTVFKIFIPVQRKGSMIG